MEKRVCAFQIYNALRAFGMFIKRKNEENISTNNVLLGMSASTRFVISQNKPVALARPKTQPPYVIR